MKLLPALALFALAACQTPGAVVRDRIVEVKVPVPQPCAGQRPAAIIPLNQQFPAEQWASFDVKQRAALVGRQALERLDYGEQLNAATASCP